MPSRGKHSKQSSRNSQPSQSVSSRRVQRSSNTRSISSLSLQTQDVVKKRRGKRRFWNVVFAISLVVLVASLTGLGVIAYQYWAQDNAYSSLEDYANIEDVQDVPLSDLTVDWDGLRAINPDIVAWVYVPDTKINYPVVQTDNNDTYLHTSFDGQTGLLGSAGCIFLDYRNNPELLDQNSAIYGHYMNDGSMFGTFSSMTNDESFNQQRDIFLLTPKGNYHLRTFSCILTTGDDALVRTTFSSDEEYLSYVQDLFDRSVVNQIGPQVKAEDVNQSFMFSTCEYSQANGRAVICAAVIETTIADNPYVSPEGEQGTGLDQSQAASIGN